MMKKILIALSVLMAGAICSFGVLSVDWYAYGLYGQGGDDVLADSGTDHVLWQLVWTSQSEGAAPAPTLNSDGSITLGGDGILLSERYVTKVMDGDTVTGGKATVTDNPAWESNPSQATMDMYNWLESKNGGLNFFSTDQQLANMGKSSGSIYTIVFQYLEDNNVYYLASDLVTPNWAADKTAAGAQVGWADEDTISTHLGQFDGPTVVPEPATMSLLGLGALAMVLRRRRLDP